MSSSHTHLSDPSPTESQEDASALANSECSHAGRRGADVLGILQPTGRQEDLGNPKMGNQ